MSWLFCLGRRHLPSPKLETVSEEPRLSSTGTPSVEVPASVVLASAELHNADHEDSPREESSSVVLSREMPSNLRIEFTNLTFHELIGKGAFKAVYRGRWNGTNVAIVSMRKGGIVKEARIQQLIGNHPNIVQFYRWTMDDSGNEYMVMEFLKMGSMDKVLTSHGKSLRSRQRVAMCEQICNGMYELISVGVLHRDLASRNILVASMDPVQVKISDFGLAWIQAGGVVSTPVADRLPSIPIRWSPPEVLTQYEWSEKSDVWSYGVTMWEIFSNGSEPYADSTDQQVLTLVKNFKVLARPKKCPSMVYKLMLRCWNPDPAGRPTFADILQVFKDWRNSCQEKRGSTAPKAIANATAGMPPSSRTNSGQQANRAAEDHSIPVACTTFVPIDLKAVATKPTEVEALNPKFDVLHMTDASLSDDGSSSNHSRSGTSRVMCELKFEAGDVRQSPNAGLRDMSLDYLLALRVPSSAVAAEPRSDLVADRLLVAGTSPPAVGYSSLTARPLSGAVGHSPQADGCCIHRGSPGAHQLSAVAAETPSTAAGPLTVCAGLSGALAARPVILAEPVIPHNRDPDVDRSSRMLKQPELGSCHLPELDSRCSVSPQSASMPRTCSTPDHRPSPWAGMASPVPGSDMDWTLSFEFEVPIYPMISLSSLGFISDSDTVHLDKLDLAAEEVSQLDQPAEQWGASLTRTFSEGGSMDLARRGLLAVGSTAVNISASPRNSECLALKPKDHLVPVVTASIHGEPSVNGQVSRATPETAPGHLSTPGHASAPSADLQAGSLARHTSGRGDSCKPKSPKSASVPLHPRHRMPPPRMAVSPYVDIEFLVRKQATEACQL